LSFILIPEKDYLPDQRTGKICVESEKNRACNRAGLKDFRFHDLRHSFASYLTMGGVNLRTVQTLLGNKDLRMTMRYSHLSPEHPREAVESALQQSIP
jgi:site-specific recombinase XerD